ncbi:MAG: 2-amino-4-hydroxy-6-hydroxymethyldihydropteridine diphosphokinase [Synergistes sp.]|nr:2-amino-4-hydroxy-6-hydroxymethyldihydropteridine diphosphokinase [Synergistes sp.]
MNEHTVLLSLGSNLGDRLGMLRRAVEMLKRNGAEITDLSRVYETMPWGVTEQPLFLNICAKAQTASAPGQLLEMVKNIESGLGRRRGKRWGPREIDIDIIFYDRLVYKDERPVIPHPHMHERGFVLAPLSEIAPGYVHPVFSKSVAELLAGLSQREKDDMIWITKI